jgi:VanZ family protein
MHRKHVGWIRFGPCLAWMLVISAFSTAVFSAQHTGSILLPILHRLFPAATPAALNALHDAVRKSMHLLEFGVLALLWCRALSWERARWQLRTAALALLIAVSFAALDESHQVFVPGRTASIKDVGWDGTGALIALAVGLALLG